MFKKLRLAPGTLRALLKDRRFWLIEGLVVCLAVVHDLLEGAAFMAAWGNLHFLPVALLWLPVWYSAWVFGFAGSATTALTALIAFIPNFLFWHQGSSLAAELSEVTFIVLVGFMAGYLVDQAKTARLSAKLFADHAVRSREEDRRRISRDLHDQTIQAMVTVIRELDGIRRFKQDLPLPVANGLLAIRDQLEQIIGDLRRYVTMIRPSILDDMGLAASLQQLLTGFAARTGVSARVEVAGKECPLAPEQKACLFRIVQEALANAERHAGASSIVSTLTFTAGEVILEVRDDGAGFEIPPTLGGLARSGKFGLLGMIEYAELLGGRLKVDSSPGEGTGITVTVPARMGDGRLREMQMGPNT